VELDSSNFKSYDNLGLALSNRGHSDDIAIEEADIAYTESQECFNKSIELAPKMISGYLNSAISYYYQAQTHSQSLGDATAYLSRAYGRFKQASEAENTHIAGRDTQYSAYHNWGMALFLEGGLAGQSQETSRDLYTQAEAKVRLRCTLLLFITVLIFVPSTNSVFSLD
jgi:tetratricopeptide (TPR) repeat protein